MSWTSNDSASSRRPRRPARIAIAVPALALALVVIVGAGDAAHAKKAVVVLNFVGPRTAKVQAGVTRLVRKRATIISADKYKRAQRKLRAIKPNNRNVSRVARRVGADGVLVGSMERRGGKYRLKLRLREGRSGRFVKTVNVVLTTPRLTRRAEQQIRNELLPAVSNLSSIDADEERVASRRRGRDRNRARDRDRGDDDDDDDIEDDDDGDDGGDDDGDAAVSDDEPDDEVVDDTRVARRDADGDDDPPRDDREDSDDSDESTDDRLYRELARDRGVDVAVGVSFISRKLDFTVRDGLMDQPNGYSGNMVPGAYVQAELYPMSFDRREPNKSALSGIGAYLVFDRVFSIESQVEGSDQGIPTTQTRWGIGARFRYNFGSSPTSPSIKLGIAYNKLEFFIDKDAAADMGLLLDIPNVDYTYFDPGLAFRYPVSLAFALYAEAKFLLVTDSGEVQADDQYGPGTITGFDADIGVEYRFTPKILMRAGGRYQAIAFDFDGTGDLANNRDMDPGSVDVGGALDRYLGAYATIGYLF